MVNSQLKLDGVVEGISLEMTGNQTYLLSVLSNVRIDEPIKLIFPESGDFSVSLTLKIGENGQASIVEIFEGDEKREVDYHLSINAEQNSSLKIFTLQNLSPQSTFGETRNTMVQAGAMVHFLNFQLGAQKANGKIHQSSIGISGELNTDLFCRARDNQRYDFDVINSYNAPQGRGKIFVKGIADDHAHLSLKGMIQIAQNGSGTDTYLKQDSLLLSESAKVKATPALKIDTNDVKASHGSSIVNLNDETLFYLTARGINPSDARKLLIAGFAADQLDKLNALQDLKETIQNLI